MNALILHPLVARERLAAAHDAGFIEGWCAALTEAGANDTHDGVKAGLDAALWALAELQKPRADTLQGRILVVAHEALGPDAAASLLQSAAGLSDDAALSMAVATIARAVL